MTAKKKAPCKEWDEKTFPMIQEKLDKAAARFLCSLHKKKPKIKLTNLGRGKMKFAIVACCDEFEGEVLGQILLG